MTELYRIQQADCLDFRSEKDSRYYLFQLPEPLITFDLYNDFITVGKDHPAPG